MTEDKDIMSAMTVRITFFSHYLKILEVNIK